VLARGEEKRRELRRGICEGLHHGLVNGSSFLFLGVEINKK
jgi:hypothetical protein